MQEAWSQKDPLKAYPEVQKIMHCKLYICVRKHFRVSYSRELPGKDEPGYHPVQSVNWALGYLRSKAQLLWNPGKILCLDEYRVKSRSRHTAYKTREPDKPIREGWTVVKLGETGQKGGAFVLNDLVNILSQREKLQCN